MAQLQKLPGVKVFPRDEKLKEKQAKSRIWNETWLSAFFHKPCNHELFVLQSLNMEGEAHLHSPFTNSGDMLMLIEEGTALNDGVHWIQTRRGRKRQISLKHTAEPYQAASRGGVG